MRNTAGASPPYLMVIEMTDIKALSAAMKKNRIKWGFVWAILCAVFWGLGYVPLQLVWMVPPFAEGFPYFGASEGMVVSAILMSATQALVFTIVLFLLWTCVTGKFKDYVRTLVNFKVNKWFIVGCIFGGPMAILGSTLATGYIGAAFAASIGLLSTVVGAFLGWAINKEKFSKKAIIGIIMIFIGGIVILDPVSMMEEISNSSNGAILGYIGGIMSAIGWGCEGNFAVRALDVTDSDAGITVRYTYETIIWFVVMFPVTIAFTGLDNFGEAFVSSFSSGNFIFWEFAAGLTLGLCYVMQYKAFPLVGVGRTLSIGSLYVPVSVVALFVFLGQVPSWMLVIGVILAVVGTFVMYWESDSLDESMRDTGGAKDES